MLAESASGRMQVRCPRSRICPGSGGLTPDRLTGNLHGDPLFCSARHTAKGNHRCHPNQETSHGERLSNFFRQGLALQRRTNVLKKDSRQMFSLLSANDHTRDVVMLRGSPDKFVEILHDV